MSNSTNANGDVQVLLEKIKDRTNQYIDSLNLNSTAKRAIKAYVNRQIDRLPETIRNARAQRLVAAVMKNRILAQSPELQRQIGAAYWTIKVASQSSPAEKEAVVQELLDASCFQMSPGKKQAIADQMVAECRDFQCGPMVYWTIFNQVDVACWVGLLNQ